MAKKLKKISGAPGYYKRPKNNVVINMNESQLQSYKNQITKVKELKQIQSEMNQVKEDLNDIKNLLRKLLDK